MWVCQAHCDPALAPLSMDLLRPWALLALVLLIPTIWLATVSRTSASRWRRIAGTTLRAVAVIALVLAVAEARLVRTSDKVCVTLLVDQSKSIDPHERRRTLKSLATALRGMTDEQRVAVIAFGGRSVLQQLPAGSAPLTSMQGQFARDFTDIGQAIRLALSVAPQDASNRIILLSDGNDTVAESTALAAASMARQANVPIDVLALDSASAGDVRVDRLLVDSQVQAGQPFKIKAAVHSETAQTVRVTMTQRGRMVSLGGEEGRYYRTVRLEPGTNLIEVATEQIADGGFYDYEVGVEPVGGDPVQANNRATGVVRVIGAPTVLIVDGSEGGRQGRNLLGALQVMKIKARLVDVSQYPTSRIQFDYHDCLVLSDVPADALSTPQMELTQQWVRAGGGLVWVGGMNSFGPGGYARTPIEEASPVSCNVKRYIERASMALAIAIDQSGSMGAPAGGGDSKMDLANNAAAAAVRLLDQRDQAGVVMVDTAYKWITEPHIQRMLPTPKKRLINAVRANKPGGGGIYCKTALDASLDALSRVQASSKHIILFADTEDSEQQDGCVKLVTRARKAGVTVSTIGLGMPRPGNHAGFLEDVAKAGGGRVFFTDDARKLPRVFVRDVSIAARNAFIEPEKGIAPTLVTLRGGDRTELDPIVRGLGALPRLEGQVATTLKARASMLMYGHKPEDPLLAKWRYGLGKVVAWTSDARGKWAGGWVGWEGFAQFWSQVVRWAIRNPNLDSPVTSWAAIRGQRGVIVADAIDEKGEPIDDLVLEAIVQGAGPDAAAESVPLRLVAPGRYEGQFEPSEVGAYIVTTVDDEGRGMDAIGAVMSYSPEYRQLETNHAMLARIADTSGGRDLDRLVNLHARPPGRAFTYKPIALPLVAAAMFLFFSDIVVRRLVLPETVIRWLTPARRRQADAGMTGRLRRHRATLRKAEPSPVAVALSQQTARKTPEPQPTASEGPAAKSAPDAEPDRPAGTSGGGSLSDRLRAAKQRARQEMQDKSRRDR